RPPAAHGTRRRPGRSGRGRAAGRDRDARGAGRARRLLCGAVGLVAERAVEAVLAEARAAVAAGRPPDERALRARLGGDAEALARLDRVLAVHRARGRVERPVPGTAARPSEPPSVPGTAKRLLRTRPTVSANMDV